MAETKDKTLERLKVKVTNLENKVKSASNYSKYGTPSEKEIAQKELDAARKELEDYKIKTGKKTLDTPYAGEAYAGQSDVNTTVDKYYLDLVTQSDGSQVPANSQQIVDANGNIVTSAGTQQYIYIGRPSYGPEATGARPFEKGAYSSTITVKSSFDEVKKQILTDAQKDGPDGLKNLFDKLYRAGYINKSTADSRNLGSDDFNRGLQSVLTSYSKDFITQQKYGDKTQEPISFDAYLSSTKKVGTSKTEYIAVATLKQDAIKDIDAFFVQFIGRGATTAEEDEYFKALRDLEKKNVVRTTTTEGGQTKSGQLVTEEDRLQLQRKIAGRALNGSSLDNVLKTGSASARSITGLVDYAKQYGIKLSTKDAADFLAQDLSGGTFDEKAIKARISSISKATYSNLSELSDTISLKDLSRNLISTMGQVLELDPNGIDVMDPTIQKALKNNGNKGIMNLNDFEIMLRNDPRWAKTKNAKEEASRYAYEILNSFGLMA